MRCFGCASVGDVACEAGDKGDELPEIASSLRFWEGSDTSRLAFRSLAIPKSYQHAALISPGSRLEGQGGSDDSS